MNHLTIQGDPKLEGKKWKKSDFSNKTEPNLHKFIILEQIQDDEIKVGDRAVKKMTGTNTTENMIYRAINDYGDNIEILEEGDMKQQITEKQWDELDRELQLDWEAEFDTQNLNNNQVGMLPSIGQMIEFLGGSIEKIRHIENSAWEVEMRGGEIDSFAEDELCDALWEAVKEKLKIEDRRVI